MVERPDAMYHTAYDVMGDFKAIGKDPELRIDTEREQAYLEAAGLVGKKYITLNTGLNMEYLNKGNTRAWPFENWAELSLKIKEKHPYLQIVQVGISLRDEDAIPADIHMNGRTTLEQINILLKNALIHVDYDGGLVHVRHTTRGKSLVLMGPSAAENHRYEENRYIHTKVCHPCEWIRQDWLSVCQKGQGVPPCMESITVEMVMDEIDRLLEEVKA